MYGKVENNNVIKTGSLRQLIPNCSNPELLSKAEMHELGVYSITKDVTVLKPWESFGESTYDFISASNTIEETKAIKSMSMDEHKSKKYKEIATDVHEFVTSKYPYYKQLSALNGTYGEEESKAITDWCDKYVKLALNIKAHIFSRTTHKAIEDTFFRQVEYDIDSADIISEKFWGED